VGVYNCLGVETAFVTSNGVRTFADFADGDRTCVLGHSGQWRDATVRRYVRQVLNTYTFVRGRTVLKVRATANHRWLLDSPMHETWRAKANEVGATLSRGRTALIAPAQTTHGSWETTDLQVGDRLVKVAMPFKAWEYSDADPLERRYWAYGYVYGDGTRVKTKDGIHKYSMVRLCGAEIKYRDRFEELGFKSSSSLSLDGDYMAYAGKYLKTLPDIAKDGVAMVRAFVRGYLDADGTKVNQNSARNPFPTIQATGEESIKFIREVFPSVGVYILREEDVTARATNFGERSAITMRFSLLAAVGDGANGYYSCNEVVTGDVEEDVWCLEVDVDASFTLANGLVTGNCAFQFLQNTTDMAEELYVLMQGTGVGFSVEAEFSVEKFSRVKRQKKHAELVTYVIEDSTEGWCDAYKTGLNAWLGGEDLKFDYGRIREAGVPLKTKGGKASGPGPLKDLLEFARTRILARQGRYLTSLDLYDINCFAHRIVRMGGVRRASGISLSDLNDRDMRDCKRGEFWTTNNQRNQANNSAVYNEKPDVLEWMEEWLALARSGSGERGIFNRGALKQQFPKRRKSQGHVFGVNPCGEIILRNKQFCNLSIAVIRVEDTYEEIARKVVLATIWGTLQATMTNFKYIGDEWKKNSEEERLLGVDLLGFLDHPLFRNNADAAGVLDRLRAKVLEVNAQWSERLGISPSTATTCIKPSGDSSVFFNTAAGFKGHHGEFYVRRVRANATNPVAQMLQDEGVPCLKDYDGSGLVLEFPMQAPANGVLLESQTAISQLEQWKTFKLHWTEHNPSVTIYVRPDEWLTVGKWVYDNWEIVGGLSFLPYSGGVYHLAPYEEINRAEYERRMASFPKINWAKLLRYEKSDMTDLQQQVACTGGACAL